jgi:aminoglycoside phosphotransferase family enzyme/predicted kinase
LAVPDKDETWARQHAISPISGAPGMNTSATLARATDEMNQQEQLLPFLLNRETYPHRPRKVRLVQTHSAFVFLAPPFVYKVKKPVNFGFLDFSTLEKRRHFCERELALNRRLCPKMYLEVVPICKVRENFRFGGTGAVVEYAVKMRHLSERYFLDKLVARKAVSLGDLDRIVVKLKRFYEAQNPSAETEVWGSLDRLRVSTDENFRQTEPFLGQTLSRPACEGIRLYTREFYAGNAGLFESRMREHRIRDCHGDLHLEHIHITRRTLQIFDCIEFNDRLRFVDVASDAAFLGMDLDYEGRPDLARYFAAKMATALGDAGMSRLIDFYKCYRAYVRGKVESLHAVAHAVPASERETSSGRARLYFRLALQYAITGSEPVVLVVMGRIGSGKSTLARALGKELAWPVFSSDRVRKELAGFPLFERPSEASRSWLYSTDMTEKTYGRLIDSAIEQVARGHSIILDATFARRSHREELKARFTSHGIDFRVLEANADEKTVKQRLQERETKPDEVSDARLADFENLASCYEPPKESEEAWVFTVDTVASVEQTVTSAIKVLVKAHLKDKCHFQ